METTQRKYQRKRIVVHPRLQFKFAGFVMFLTFGTAFITSAIVFFTTFSILGERLASVYPQGRLIEVFRQVYILFGITLLAAAPVIVIVSLKFSHRIVGPLPKIYRILKGVGKGNFDQKLVLREKDQLSDLADVINQMIADLRSRKE
jgi:methyl-accepting chemotaxis protein